MSYKKGISTRFQIPTILTAVLLLGLAGCSGSGSDDGIGYMQLYNASPNSPVIYLVVDIDDDDDFNEATYASVNYTQSSTQVEFLTDTYDVSLSWQDDDDNSVDNLEAIYETQITVTTDDIQFIVIADEITAPNVLIYDIPVVDDDDDDDDDLFNIRFLNMHTWTDGVDIYLSESDETFSQATLIGQYNYTDMSENQKFEQDEYIFYITSAGSDEVLYESEEISYQTVSQYVMVIRENNGSGSSPFTLDRVTKSAGTQEYPDYDAEAQYRIYNGMVEHELIPEYLGGFDMYLDGVDNPVQISSLGLGEFSDSYITDFGDFSITLTNSENDEIIVENHLLTLNINADRTVFFYFLEEAVDEDEDGVFDENEDGIIDEYKISVNSVVVDYSANGSVFDHQVKVINLVDEFDSLGVYFVRSDETIETANYSVIAQYTKPRSVTLVNNTYTVYLIGEEDSGDVILETYELTLDQDSKDFFLILEENASFSTGYTMTFRNQKD